MPSNIEQYLASETEAQKKKRLAQLPEYFANETEAQKKKRLENLTESMAKLGEAERKKRGDRLKEYIANRSEAQRQADNAKMSQGHLKRPEAERKEFAERTLQTAIANGHSPAQVFKRISDEKLVKLQEEKEEFEKDETHKFIPFVVTCGACDLHFIHTEYKEVQIWSDDGKELLLTMKVPVCTSKTCASARHHIESKTVDVRTHIEGQLTIQKVHTNCRETGDPDDCSCSKFREVLRKAVNEAIKELRKEHETRYGPEADWSEKQRGEFNKKKFNKSRQVIGHELDTFEDEHGIKTREHESGDRVNAQIKELQATVGKNRKPFNLLDGIDLNGSPELKSEIEKLIASHKVEYDMIKAKVHSELASDSEKARREPAKFFYRVPKVNKGDDFIVNHYEIIVVQLSIALLMLYVADELERCDYCNCKLFFSEVDEDYVHGLKIAIDAAILEDESKKHRELTQKEKTRIELVTTAQYKKDMHGCFFSLDRRFNGAGHSRLSNLNNSCYACNCNWRKAKRYEDWIEVMAEDEDGLYQDGPFRKVMEDGSVVIKIPDLRERLQGHGLDILNIPSVIALHGNNQYKALAKKAGYNVPDFPSDLSTSAARVRRDQRMAASAASSSSSSSAAFAPLPHNNNNNNNNNDDEDEDNLPRMATSAASSSSSSSASAASRQSFDPLLHNNNNNPWWKPRQQKPQQQNTNNNKKNVAPNPMTKSRRPRSKAGGGGGGRNRKYESSSEDDDSSEDEYKVKPKNSAAKKASAVGGKKIVGKKGKQRERERIERERIEEENEDEDD